MRLLVVTQAVDENDPVLGFFIRWIEALSRRFESIEVICLREGNHTLPQNVRVHSLGKERGVRTRGAYALRFLALVWRLRYDYDAVFVHMNQEYVLLAGLLWKLLGKRVYLWRNHYAGSLATDIAAAFCNKIFCTSKHSYTAKYAKTMLMPVGVDTERFHPDAHIARLPHSILFLARIAPAKRAEMLLDALGLLQKKGIPFSATICGSPLPADENYYAALKAKAPALGIADSVVFTPAVANSAAPDLYRAHEVFVNCSRSGMLDKTLFEAAASGCFVLAASEDFGALAGADHHFSSVEELAKRLTTAFALPPQSSASYVAANDLSALTTALTGAIYSGNPI